MSNCAKQAACKILASAVEASAKTQIALPAERAVSSINASAMACTRCDFLYAIIDCVLRVVTQGRHTVFYIALPSLFCVKPSTVCGVVLSIPARSSWLAGSLEPRSHLRCVRTWRKTMTVARFAVSLALLSSTLQLLDIQPNDDAECATWRTNLLGRSPVVLYLATY